MPRKKTKGWFLSQCAAEFHNDDDDDDNEDDYDTRKIVHLHNHEKVN